MNFLNKKLMTVFRLYNIAEIHQFPRNSVMEFSEYLQWDRMAPFFVPPCTLPYLAVTEIANIFVCSVLGVVIFSFRYAAYLHI